MCGIKVFKTKTKTSIYFITSF